MEDSEEKKVDVLKIIFTILFVIVSVVFLVFLSTKLRWDYELENHENLIMDNGDGTYKVSSVEGFYGDEVDPLKKGDTYRLLQCSDSYGGSCILIDPSDKMEVLLRNPSNFLIALVLFDVILLFLILKDKKYNKVFFFIACLFLFGFGVFNLGKGVFLTSNYYGNIKDKYKISVPIVGKLDTYKENIRVVKYDLNGKERISYVSKLYDKLDLGSKMDVYYNPKNYDEVIVPHSISNYVLVILEGVGYLLLGGFYVRGFFSYKKKLSDENNSKNK